VAIASFSTRSLANCAIIRALKLISLSSANWTKTVSENNQKNSKIYLYARPSTRKSINFKINFDVENI